MKPTVLVASTAPWISSAKLAIALAKAGWRVQAFCAYRHPLRAVHALDRVYTYHFLAPLRSFARAIAHARPDLVIPGDGLAVSQLHALHRQARQGGSRGEWLCALIERSLGSPAYFSVLFQRSALLALAEAEGIRVPKTQVISSTDDLQTWISEMGLPTVLKADRTWSGAGVRIVWELEKAKAAFCSLQAPPQLLRAAKRALVNGETALLRPALLRRRYIMNAQSYVEGREATSLIACWKGAVVGSLQFEVLHEQSPGGPATVLRLIENAEIAAAGEKMALRLQLSGLHGLDFMLQKATGHPYLIELNPRTTQVGHLALGPGRDLPAALFAFLTGQEIRPAPRVTEKDTIAIFPSEWIRNPASTFLQSAYHDVPWEEPGLVLAGIHTRRQHNVWLSRQKWMETFSPSRRDRL